MKKVLYTTFLTIIMGLVVFLVWDYKSDFKPSVVEAEEVDAAIDIILLGDSNTQISYFEDVPEKRWAFIIGKELNANVYNYGLGGRAIADFLKSGKSIQPKDKWVGESWKKQSADYHIIGFGLNDDEHYSPMEFEVYLREMVEIISNEKQSIPILMTNVHVPYPEYFSWDRNEVIDKFDDVKRKLAKELDLHLIDANERFKTEWEVNGVWDTRIRNTELWDSSQDDGKTVEEEWFDDIHLNELGNEIVADEAINYFQENYLVD